MEDSGFDSGDVKNDAETDERTSISLNGDSSSERFTVEKNGSSPLKPPTRSSAQLQKKIEKRIEQAKKFHSTSNGIVENQPRKSIIPINRLHVPGRIGSGPIRDGAEQPLVSWETDSEDEYEFPSCNATSSASTNPVREEKHKDSFNPDLTPDEDDLDLIPPRPLQHRWACCPYWGTNISNSSSPLNNPSLLNGSSTFSTTCTIQ